MSDTNAIDADPNGPSLMKAIQDNDLETANSIVTISPLSIWYREPTTGKSPLHLAAAQGNAETVQYLLTQGHQWNAVDLEHRTAAEDARDAGFPEIWDLLLNEGIRVEMILAVLGKKPEAGPSGDGEDDEDDSKPSNADYLASKLHFSEGRILDDNADGVMMGWEAPLMERHAEVIAPREGLDVLNVGFGMGLVDGYLQARKPKTHTIIEAHPDVYKKMIEDGWDKKPGVRILFGRWQDVMDQLETYDGIFFDTFGEFYDDLRQFHDHLPNILREDGIYSYFNGLSGSNPFFHEVSCAVAEADLSDVGLKSEIVEIKMDELGDDVWNGVRRPYFTLDVYKLPICRHILFNSHYSISYSNRIENVHIEIVMPSEPLLARFKTSLAIVTVIAVIAASSSLGALASPSPIPAPAPAPAAASSGNSPVTSCGTPTDLLSITELTVVPEQPKKGKEVTLKAVGDLKESVGKGALMKAQVKMGPIKLLDVEMDLCEKLEGIGKSCPLPAGETVIEQTFTIPYEVPPGRYSVHIDILTKDRDSVACINANLRL
ncbi:hypothetical protein HDU97_006823 [Phlyctochytrium planicorne]|nr:hypothetical protein HDU97_006823 [Phlyctochytrium planicorne]